MIRSFIVVIGLAVVGCSAAQKKAPASPAPVKAEKVEKRKNMTAYFDIEYAKVGDHSLKLDLLVPTNAKQKPNLIVFFHGGSWRGGSKKTNHIGWLVGHGYAVASVDYRLTKVAKFPALMHDAKGSIRFLRAHADNYGYAADKVGVAGASAGGLLAALAATSGGVKELEGDVGGNLDQSSRVQAALCMFCPIDMVFHATTKPEVVENKNSPLYQLIGGKPSQNMDTVKLASATTHVTQDDPPMILLYGGADKGVIQSVHGERMKKLCDKVGVEAHFQVIPGAGHGGPRYRDAERKKLILDVLKRSLRDASP